MGGACTARVAPDFERLGGKPAGRDEIRVTKDIDVFLARK